jgi:ubiquinone/menaquinone biosynthesis C-methylase UbiE
MNEMSEKAIREFWDAHPCGESQVERLHSDYEDFFRRYDAFRYQREAHILRRLDAVDFRGKQVLEIGLGQGADSEQIIRRGAIWSGVDISAESVSRVSTRLRCRGLAYARLERASALDLPFPDDRFDIVFAHGVLHHIPDVLTAQKEIARVLKPGGRLIAMLYARRSLNYLLAISVVRRLSLAILFLGRPKAGDMVGRMIGGHIANAKRMGLREYLRMPNFIHGNTDGPFNPYSKVYDLTTVKEDFPAFTLENSYQDYMHAPPLPVFWLKPFARVLGWHLWVHLNPRK